MMWDVLPAELLELVIRRLLSPESCTLSSMKHALALAGCCKGTKGLFDDTRQRLRLEHPKHMNGDVFFELEVVGWTLVSFSTNMFLEWHQEFDTGEGCPYKVGFVLKWGIDSSCRRPDAKCPLDFHVLVALKEGSWDGASNPPSYLVVDRSVTNLGERGYVVGGNSSSSAEPGQIVINQHETELPSVRHTCGYVRQVVVKSDPLVAFLAS